MLDRCTQPPIRDFETINLIPPRQFRLQNGIVFHLFDNERLNLIHLTIKIKAGALYEPKKRLSSFCYNLIKESHKTMTSNEIDAFLDYYGTAFSITAGVNQISINVLVPKKNCEKIIPFVAELLSSPVFKSGNFERYKAKTIKDFEYNSRKVDYWNTQLMFNTFFEKSVPFGKLIEKFDLEAITLEEIIHFHQETCCAENIRLFATGDIDDALIQLITDNFERIRSYKPVAALPEIAGNFTPRRIDEHWDNALQTSVSLCRPIFPYTHPDALPFRILNTLFANYFGSRLMQNLREKNGLTYGISGGTFYYETGGIYYIESDINNDKVEEAIGEIYKEMEIINDSLTCNEELEIVRNYLLGSALRNIDGTVSYLESYMEWESFGCNENRFKQYVERIRSFTAEDIKSMANKYLQKDAFTIITVGA